MVRQADQRGGIAEDGLVNWPGVAFGQPGIRVFVCFQAVGRAVPAVRQAVGQAADHFGRQAVGLGRFAQRRAAAEAVDGADRGHLPGPEALVHIADNAVAAA